MHLIAGLGNPGRRYQRTRHNVGFMLLDRVADQSEASFQKFSPHSQTCQVRIGSSQALLAKPTTYMNRSGQAVRELIDYFDLTPADCLIVYDEVALPLGTIRIRPSGSAGGHKGMKSILESLGTFQVPRLRIGVGPDHEVRDLTRFVLDKFNRAEKDQLDEVLQRCSSALDLYITEGVERAMAQHN